jgi:23S rRNA (adenine2503-C2)-methyltransferase
MDILQYDYAGLVADFGARFGKGEYHAGALFRSLYRQCVVDPRLLPEFKANPALAEEVFSTYTFKRPEVLERTRDEISSPAPAGQTYKFLMRLKDGLETESVVIPMRHYKSLCISSQVGCKMGCTFCETAQMGLLRSLDAGEIVSQVWAARHLLQEPVENLVFMGMGEPMDNLEQVLQAIRIISDQRGLNIPQTSITISTVGHVDGIRRLTALAKSPPPLGFSRIRLAVSLNAPNDSIRKQIMPVNIKWPMAELKQALRDFPLGRKGDFIFMEYVLIPGVNDAREHALEVAEYLRGLTTCVNLIPYNPRLQSPYGRPEREGVVQFYRWLMEAGQYCRVRGTKGQDTMAACGQLGNRALKRSGSRRLDSLGAELEKQVQSDSNEHHQGA